MAIRDYDRLFIGGDWIAPEGTDTIAVISPSTEEVIARVPDGTEADIDKAVAAARMAFDRGPWPRMSPAERGAILAAVGAQVMAEMNEMAEIITSEMGSPISFSTMGQVLAPSMIFSYYADLASTFAFDELRTGLLNPNMLVSKEPPETPFDTFRLAEIFADAGLPKGVLSVIPAGREVGEHLVTHPGVDKISFTGSGVGGKRIGGLCGERLKRCTLELGGKSAAIILDDADIASTIPTLLPNAIMNNGQACIAQTRILAPRDRYDEVVDALVAGVSALAVGDPLDPATEVGPVVAERQRARIEGYLESGREEGATIAVGGGRPSGLGKGWYVEPTVFTHVDNKMKIAQEEIRRSTSPTTPAMACAARCGRTTTIGGWASLARSGPVPTWSTAPFPSTLPRRSVGSKSQASVGNSARRAWRPSSRRSRSRCLPATRPVPEPDAGCWPGQTNRTGLRREARCRTSGAVGGTARPPRPGRARAWARTFVRTPRCSANLLPT